MKFRIIKTTLLITLIILLLSLISCGNKKHEEDDGHNHTTDQKTQTENRKNQDDENTTVFSEEQIKNAGIVLGRIENRQMDAVLTLNGKLRVPNSSQANATSMFGGVIKTLNVELGDHVKKGQVIATISNPEFIRLQEEYYSIESRIIFAQQEFDRQKELFDGKVGAEKNLQSASAELKAIKTRQASLERQLQMMGIQPHTISDNNLKSTLVITSPISGTVSNVYAKIGSYVDVSSPVIEIIDNHSIHIDLQVFEKDLSLISVGQKIEFTITNNPHVFYTAEVYNISSSFNDASKAIAVHGKIIGNKKGLIDGMNVTGQVLLRGSKTLAVPDDAVINDNGRDYIFIVLDKKHVESDDHDHTDGDDHDHDHTTHNHEKAEGITFKKVEIIKGSSNMGYTGISLIDELPLGVRIVTKGTFFVNAKISDTCEHSHAH